MAKILVVYGSTHGHTGKVAQAAMHALRAQGAAVDLCAADRMPSPEDYAGVVVAASVHGGKYQRSVTRWARRHAAVLNRKPTAFVSVCLGILQNDPRVQQELDEIVRRFEAVTGWYPKLVRKVAGALLYTRYNWLLRRIMRRIAAQAGGDTDTTRDFEYTDWADVIAFAEQFGRSVGPVSMVSPSVSSAA